MRPERPLRVRTDVRVSAGPDGVDYASGMSSLAAVAPPAGRRLRLAVLVVLLAVSAAAVAVWHPQRMLSDAGPWQVLLFAPVYGLCAVAFVPRPLLNLAAGALLGSVAGTAAALGGTVLGAAIAFGLGRLLGQDALRPLLRGRIMTAADRQLSEHGLRSMLALRLFPGVPFAAANYGAAVSRMRWLPFLFATAVGSVPNTTAYVIAGSHAASPASPLFLVACAVVVLPALAAAVPAARRLRRRMRG